MKVNEEKEKMKNEMDRIRKTNRKERKREIPTKTAGE